MTEAEMKAAVDAANARADAATKRADTAEGKIAVLEAAAKTHADAESKAKETFDARVRERAKLEREASAVIEGEPNFDGKSDREIKVDALSKLEPDVDCKDQSDAFVDAAYTLGMKRHAKASAAKGRVVPEDGDSKKSKADADDPRTRMINANKSQSKRKDQ